MRDHIQGRRGLFEHCPSLVRLDFSKEFVHLHTLLPLIGTTLERTTLVSLGLIFTEVIVNLTNSWVFGIGKLVSADETLLFVQRC